MTLSVTGHRPDKLGGYFDRTDQLLVKVAIVCIEELKPDEIITGMAQGWDLAVAEASAILRVPFIAAVPCDAQEKLWPLKSRQRYQKLLNEAAEVVNVSPGPYAGWKMMKRNKWMMDRGDDLLALWNGDQSGGTFNTVSYFESLNKGERYNAWELFLEMGGLK